MSDTKAKADWLTKLESVAEASDDPTLEGVVKIANHVDVLSKTVDARLGNYDKRIDEARETNKKEVEALRTTMEAGFATVVEKVSAIEKRGLVAGVLSYEQDPKGSVLSAIPDADRKFINEQWANEEKFEPMRDPIMRGASDLWFRYATMAQHGRWKSETAKYQERADALKHALDDVYTRAAYGGGTTDTVGGYGVPVITADQILWIMKDNGLALNLCRTIPMTSDTLNVPTGGSFTVYWSAEAATLTGGETTIGVCALSAKKLIARATANSEGVEDITFNLLGYVRDVMAEECAAELDKQVFEGVTTPWDGLVGQTGINSVATTTTDGDALAYTDLVQAVYKAYQASTRQNASFVMHPAMFMAIVGLVDTNGQPIFQYANVPNTVPERVLGYPAYLSSNLSIAITRGSTGSTGNIYFGPMKQMLLGQRKGFTWDVTDQVNWAKDQFDARLVSRWGFGVPKPAHFTKIVGITQLS
ncbi:MAG: phage major capsid protein [Acidobacteria bacterium]|nr:phage major capsid protein [Acidobacteriota bacterium]